MKPKVYLETTIPSYLTSRPSRDLVTAAHQQITREWWDTRRHDFDLFVSQMVLDEASAGDPEAATRRLEVLAALPLLDPQTEGIALAQMLSNHLSLPARVAADALHIAIAVVNGMDYLLTWNCTHIANAALRGRIDAACRSRGFRVPIISGFSVRFSQLAETRLSA
jgi:predicted nucleic acid-binding protein